jgi:hypothetical protein
MEIDKEQIDALKKILEPRQSFETGTELPNQHFLDMDVLALGVLHRDATPCLLNRRNLSRTGRIIFGICKNG